MTDAKLAYWLKVWREPELQQPALPIMEEEQAMTDSQGNPYLEALFSDLNKKDAEIKNLRAELAEARNKALDEAMSIVSEYEVEILQTQEGISLKDNISMALELMKESLQSALLALKDKQP